jgi:hypothetical protein
MKLWYLITFPLFDLQAGSSRVRDQMKLMIFLICFVILVALDPGFYEACNRNEYQREEKIFLASRTRPGRKTDNLNAICEPTVWKT